MGGSRRDAAVGSRSVSALEGDRDLNPLAGVPLPRRIRRFRPEPDLYVASLGGPLPYMQRLRDDRGGDRGATASGSRRPTRARRGDPAAWRRRRRALELHEVNDLIERHNRWYPIEARLPMDPRSRDFVKVGGRDYRREPLDADWVLEHFPA